MKLRTIDGVSIISGEISGKTVVITKKDVDKSIEQISEKTSELDKFNNAIVEIKNSIKNDETKKGIFEVITNKMFLSQVRKDIESTHNTAQQSVEAVSTKLSNSFRVIDAKNMNKISHWIKEAEKIIIDKIIFHHDSIVSEHVIVVIESINKKEELDLVKSWKPSGLIVKDDITFEPSFNFLQKNKIPTVKLGDKFYFVDNNKQLAIKEQLVAL